jgi:hypothetical protein
VDENAMNDARDPHWQPDPQLLAAFFDGELEGRCNSGELRARIEAWLEEHPEAAQAPAQLQQLWLDTTPATPTAAAWNQALDQIDARRRLPSPRRRPWFAAGIAAACIALFVGFGVWRLSTPADVKVVVVVPPVKTDDDVEVFPVATADEVIVLHIEGRDTNILAVGSLPVAGVLELASPGDVRVFHARPDATGRMAATVHQDGPRAPMIWAKIETD